MPRRLLTLASSLLLILCIATVGLWVRSYWVYDGFVRVNEQRLRNGQLKQIGVNIYHASGASYVVRYQVTEHLPWLEETGMSTGRWFYQRSQKPAERRWGFGFARVPCMNSSGQLTGISTDVAIPYWALALAAAILPIARAAQWRRVSRASMRLCRVCGYDLRATPGRCPECGHLPAQVPR